MYSVTKLFLHVYELASFKLAHTAVSKYSPLLLVVVQAAGRGVLQVAWYFEEKNGEVTSPVPPLLIHAVTKAWAAA